MCKVLIYIHFVRLQNCIVFWFKKDESCVQTSNPHYTFCMGFLGGQANLCAHFGWAYVADYNWWIQNILHPSWGHKPKLNATTAMKFHYKTQQLQARNQNLLL